MKTIGLLFLCLLFYQTVRGETYLFVGADFPILSEETETGQPRGIAIDVVAIIGRRLGHTITIRLYPWKRAQFMVKNGLADVLMVPHKNPERQTWIDFSADYFFTEFKKEFDQALRQMKASGEINRLLKEKYGFSDEEIQ